MLMERGMLKIISMYFDEGKSGMNFYLIYLLPFIITLKVINDDAPKSPVSAPFIMCMSGRIGNGKSQWVLRLLAHAQRMISPPTRAMLYCYGEPNEQIMRLQ